MKNKIMKNKIILFFSIILTTQLSSCQKKQNMNTEKFDWNAEATAPSSYPMVILTPNIFYSNKGEYINLIPNRSYMQDGWSGSARTWATEPKPLPDHLDIVWYSHTENKIYKGNFKLPQETIYKLFKEGYLKYGINQEKVAKSQDYSEDLHHETYHSITVGLAPQGMVVVWVVGQNRVEIGRYQAQELDKKEAEKVYLANYTGVGGENPIPMPKTVDRDKLLAGRVKPEVVDLAVAGKITCKQWDDYRLRYNWKMECNQPFEMYRLYMRFFNSEQLYYLKPSVSQEEFNKNITEPTSKVVPNYIGMYVTTRDGVNRLIRVEPFHEQETIEAFKKLHEASPDKPITMFFDIDAGFTTAKITLKNDKKEILLEKDTIKLFKLDESNDRKNEK
jgi:hypothetical protein